jgi:hypothetical protein
LSAFGIGGGAAERRQVGAFPPDREASIGNYCPERTTTMAEMNDRLWSVRRIDLKTLA